MIAGIEFVISVKLIVGFSMHPCVHSARIKWNYMLHRTNWIFLVLGRTMKKLVLFDSNTKSYPFKQSISIYRERYTHVQTFTLYDPSQVWTFSQIILHVSRLFFKLDWRKSAISTAMGHKFRFSIGPETIRFYSAIYIQ